MPVEIERKFLVVNDSWRDAAQHRQKIRQGYLANTGKCSIRVRMTESEADINIKSMTVDIVRSEYEYPIPLHEAQALLEELCIHPLITKTRHLVPHGGYFWEIDEFEDDNAELIVAEIELSRAGEQFPRPAWLGREVSNDPRYFNICLVERPYAGWKETD